MASGQSSTKVVLPMKEAESVRKNLARVHDELARVREKAHEEAEALDRIQGMIDLKYLDEMVAAVEALEERVQDVTSQSADAAEVRRELNQERKRLSKLWDAYKTQESEVAQLSKDRDALLSRLQQIQASFQGMGNVGEIRDRMLQLEKDNESLSRDVSKVAEAADKHQEQFREEQRRLAKVFRLYEDAAASRDAFQNEALAWRTWFKGNQADLPKAAVAAAKKIKSA